MRIVTKTALRAKDRLNDLLNLIYPPICRICGKELVHNRHLKENLSICKGCIEKIKKNPSPYCAKCGRSLSGATENVTTCRECVDNNFFFERNWSGFLYEGTIKEALLLFKYSGKLSLAGLFCDLLIKFLKDNKKILEGIDAALAVPLHNVKLREREFNQAYILLAAIVKEYGIKDLSGCLKRSVATKPQSELDREKRFNNIKGAFEVTKAELVYGKKLLVVDDLFTTGATLNECARVLKKAGAGKIYCLTFARGA